MFVTTSKSLSVIFITAAAQFIPWLTLGTAFPRSSFTHGDATIYLKKYGWLNSSYTDFDSDAILTFKKTLEDYQAFEKIPITGQLDNNTVETMKVPRCGLSDKINGQRFTLLGTVWEPRDLTYRVSRYPRSPQTLGGRANIDAELRRAFAVWEGVTTFTFSPGAERADMDIQFATREHGDGGRGNTFDGPSGVLAHAYAPSNGRVHFDDEEQWTMGENRGINFFQVAAHEIGHALGLGHSEVRGALMFPSYSGYVPDFRLHSDDIQGIEALYGSINENPPRERPAGRQPPRERPTGRQPPGDRPTGRQPPGDRPTGRQPPGDRPTGRQPPGDRPTGRQPPGERPTGRQPPGDRPTCRQPPGDRPTGRQPPGDRPTGRQPPGERPTGRQPPGERPTGRQPPGDRPTGRQPPGERPTGRQPPGDPPTGRQPPWNGPGGVRLPWDRSGGGTNQQIGPTGGRPNGGQSQTVGRSQWNPPADVQIL